METKMKYIGLFTLTMMLFACGSKEEIQPKNQFLYLNARIISRFFYAKSISLFLKYIEYNV